jgi:hypothetical protein
MLRGSSTHSGIWHCGEGGNCAYYPEVIVNYPSDAMRYVEGDDE